MDEIVPDTSPGHEHHIHAELRRLEEGAESFFEAIAKFIQLLKGVSDEENDEIAVVITRVHSLLEEVKERSSFIEADTVSCLQRCELIMDIELELQRIMDVEKTLYELRQRDA
ncbi:hypothetical protein V5O48_003994 [Marasmius crinis-equi]|uniref:Mediator of RNA polymerase II transcription subunit 21 n=1 Tax=Marasmius crinis-equi TaxID=585013 RepID=A0ABR3FRC5_9AGAR